MIDQVSRQYTFVDHDLDLASWDCFNSLDCSHLYPVNVSVGRLDVIAWKLEN